jgi:hypothetical protein
VNLKQHGLDCGRNVVRKRSRSGRTSATVWIHANPRPPNSPNSRFPSKPSPLASTARGQPRPAVYSDPELHHRKLSLPNWCRIERP